MQSPFDIILTREYVTLLRLEQKPFKPVQIDVDFQGETLRVPIFCWFFQLNEAPSDCSICTESIYDLPYVSSEHWTQTCAPFCGDWMWRVLPFPKKLSDSCNHPIDFCTPCLQQHIQTQLDQHGRNACNRVRCPSAGCDRVLTYEEIRLYAQSESFTTQVSRENDVRLEHD